MTTFETKTETKQNGVCVISLSGYLDAHTASDLEATMQEQINGGCHRLVIDFTELEYISSAGLGVFMVFIESVRKEGGDIKLAAMKERVFSVFDLLGFPVLFEIFKEVQEAVEAYPATA